MRERKPPKRLDADALQEYALKTLAGRALSMGELRQRLERRAERPDDVPATIAKLKEFGYLNDQRFAESFVAARLENQGLGKMRVLRDLRTRRVAPGLAEQAVNAAYRDVDEPALIQEYLERKYRGVDLREELADEKRLASVYRRLRRAGFSHGPCLTVLFRYTKRAGELEEPEE